MMVKKIAEGIAKEEKEMTREMEILLSVINRLDFSGIGGVSLDREFKTFEVLQKLYEILFNTKAPNYLIIETEEEFLEIDSHKKEFRSLKYEEVPHNLNIVNLPMVKKIGYTQWIREAQDLFWESWMKDLISLYECRDMENLIDHLEDMFPESVVRLLGSDGGCLDVNTCDWSRRKGWVNAIVEVPNEALGFKEGRKDLRENLISELKENLTQVDCHPFYFANLQHLLVEPVTYIKDEKSSYSVHTNSPDFGRTVLTESVYGDYAKHIDDLKFDYHKVCKPGYHNTLIILNDTLAYCKEASVGKDIYYADPSLFISEKDVGLVENHVNTLLGSSLFQLLKEESVSAILDTEMEQVFFSNPEQVKEYHSNKLKACITIDDPYDESQLEVIKSLSEYVKPVIKI